MLEIRYSLTTNKVTGWCGDERQFGNLKDRGKEAIVILDVAIPELSCQAYLFDETNQALLPNPDYIEPEEPRDLEAEMDDMKVRMDKLEKGKE